MEMNGEAVVDATFFERSRAQLGGAFIRLLGYFREDGVKAVAQIEEAMRAGDAAAMVTPAHRLKGEAYQFGAARLGDLAERIELGARKCVETRDAPDELLVDVVALAPLFSRTLDWFDAATNPLVQRGSH